MTTLSNKVITIAGTSSFVIRLEEAFVHGKLTLLSGEICASRDRRSMRTIPEGSIRLTNDQAYSVAVDGYESLKKGSTKQTATHDQF